MRDQPLPVRRVARKTATQLVIDPATDHLVQAETGMVQRSGVPREVVMMEKEPQREGLRKLGRPAKTALRSVGRSQQLVPDLRQGRRLEYRGFRRSRITIAGARAFLADAKAAKGGDMPGQVLRLLLDLRTAI